MPKYETIGPPMGLSENAKKYWLMFADKLTETKRLNILTAPQFADYCNVVALTEELWMIVQRDGVVNIETLAESPASVAFRKYAKLSSDLSKRWGMLPEKASELYQNGKEEIKEQWMFPELLT